MGLKIHGVNQLLNQLDDILGEQAIKHAVDEAIKDGSLILGMELHRQIKTFSDGTGYSKGYSLEEIHISEPMDRLGNRMIVIHWKGRHSRYRIIHLNEWGTIQNPNPRGKGKIAKAMKLAQREYGRVVRESLRRYIK